MPEPKAAAVLGLFPCCPLIGCAVAPPFRLGKGWRLGCRVFVVSSQQKQGPPVALRSAPRGGGRRENEKGETEGHRTSQGFSGVWVRRAPATGEQEQLGELAN